MASGKSKRKAAPRKSAKRSSAKRAAAPAKAAPAKDVEIVRGQTVALVSKGADKTPVQLRDQAHLDELRQQFGAEHVEVQP